MTRPPPAARADCAPRGRSSPCSRRSSSSSAATGITFATMIVIPLVQLLLFGYAINTDPKHLPTAVLVQDDSAFARSFLAAMRATDYFAIRYLARSEDELDHLLLSGAGAVRRADPGAFRPRPDARRAPGAPGHRRRHRSDRDRRRRRGARGPVAQRLRPRPPRTGVRASRRGRRPTSCASTAATIRPARRGSTSCPA